MDDFKAWIVKEFVRPDGQKVGETRTTIIIGTRQDCEKQLPWGDSIRSRGIEGPYDFKIAIKP